MKGYKAFDKNLICRGFQYEIGKTYEMDGEIKCCERGFHFCTSLVDCYRYYAMTDATRICKVEAIGDITTNDDIKYCTNKIKIVSEVKNPRKKSNLSTSSSGYCNCGSRNSGNHNNGDWNTGDSNIGDGNRGFANIGNNNSGKKNVGSYNIGNYNCGNYNSKSLNRGNHNSGICNSGHYNSGGYNRGSYNSGDFNNGDNNIGFNNSGNNNIGDKNAGDWNTGSYNCGDWNKGSRHVGIFNCDADQKIKIFDKESDWTMIDWYYSRAYKVMLRCPIHSTYECDNDQKDDTDQKTPKVPVLSEVEDTNIRQKWWDNLSEGDKNAVKSLPNFDAEKFYICTGIKV